MAKIISAFVLNGKVEVVGVLPPIKGRLATRKERLERNVK